MMFNRTLEFRQTVEEKKKAFPDGKRRKITRPPRRPLTDLEGEHNALLSSKEYVAEAYIIVSRVETRHLCTRFPNDMLPFYSSIT
jgi:hypothetical protein